MRPVHRAPLTSPAPCVLQVAEKLDGQRAKKESAEQLKLPEAERTPLKAAVMLLARGATQPWPALMTTLLSSLGERPEPLS